MNADLVENYYKWCLLFQCILFLVHFSRFRNVVGLKICEIVVVGSQAIITVKHLHIQSLNFSFCISISVFFIYYILRKFFVIETDFLHQFRLSTFFFCSPPNFTRMKISFQELYYT